MSQANPMFLPALVSGAGLSRLRWTRPKNNGLTAALTQLRDAGVQATVSKLDPKFILGGLCQIQTEYGAAYEDAFWIEPAAGGYVARLCGPGNLSREVVVSSLAEAVDWVIEATRVLGDADPQAGS